ncbi:hypothetical protein, partial [Acidithiobacillus ferrianus]|uniref:hypothetical protein n=1 Tax=Acidithiobacillus ferrianus TaxID=2678518 RepID=UPI0034E61928
MHEFSCSGLISDEGLAGLDERFLYGLAEGDRTLAEVLRAYRSGGEGFEGVLGSDFLLRLAPWVERFIG